MLILYYPIWKINNYCTHLTLSRRRSLKASIASFLSLNTSLGSGVLVRLPGAESLLDPLSSSAARNTFSSEKNCTWYNINTITTTRFRHSRSQKLISLLTTNSLFHGSVTNITHVRLFNAQYLFLTCYPCRLQSVILYRVMWWSGVTHVHTLQGWQPILCMWWWWLWYKWWRPVKLCILKFTPHRYSFGCWLHKYQSSCHSHRHSIKITVLSDIMFTSDSKQAITYSGSHPEWR